MTKRMAYLNPPHTLPSSAQHCTTPLLQLCLADTCRRFFWRPWCVARSNARMLKLSESSLSPIRDSFSRESSFFLMWDSTWWWPFPCEKDEDSQTTDIVEDPGVKSLDLPLGWVLLLVPTAASGVGSNGVDTFPLRLCRLLELHLSALKSHTCLVLYYLY